VQQLVPGAGNYSTDQKCAWKITRTRRLNGWGSLLHLAGIVVASTAVCTTATASATACTRILGQQRQSGAGVTNRLITTEPVSGEQLLDKPGVQLAADLLDRRQKVLQMGLRIAANLARPVPGYVGPVVQHLGHLDQSFDTHLEHVVSGIIFCCN